MKKILTLLSILALVASVANAQQRGERQLNQNGAMWGGMADAIANSDIDANVKNAFNEATQLREQLQALCDAYAAGNNGSTEGWTPPADIVEQLKLRLQVVQEYWRTANPDRPAIDGERAGAMLQRRDAYKAQSGLIQQTRQQIRDAEAAGENCDALKQQLQEQLGDRGKLLRERRNAEANRGGDGNG